MRYLLDVNALLALLLVEHTHYFRTLAWVQGLTRQEGADLVTCPITELGFVRILGQAPYNRTTEEAKELLELARAGTTVRFLFQPDNLPASTLPAWVIRSRQVTDGYLLQLAKENGAILATLDEKIPGAFLIPR